MELVGWHARAEGQSPDLSFKHAVPTATTVVARRRLFAQLDGGVKAAVTVVAAAAGWGKTVLASSWLAGAEGRAQAWVHLDAKDDDSVAFWHTMAKALIPVAGAGAATALRGVVAGAARADDPPAALTAAASLADKPVVLVLDNLQEVTAAEVHEGLVRLIEMRPQTLSLLVLTRRDPPWPMARLRLAGMVVEMRAEDLAFRTDEAAELFERLGLHLNSGQVQRLVERTEGWAAGLRLVALHLHGRADIEAAVAAFSGDDHSVAGYLVSEVLDEQPAELLEFLRKISILDVVCPDLARAVTGRDDSEQVLAELAASQLFMQAVDRPGRWYHLHRLISDILRARPAPRRQIRDLYRRAAEWFSRNDMPLDAIRCATEGRIWPLAADLVGRHTAVCVLHGQARELEQILSDISRVDLAAHVELNCGLAGARIVQGNGFEVAELLAVARAGLAGLREGRAARARFLVDLIAGALARVRGEWDTVTALYRALPIDAVALARLRFAEPELLPVVVANILGTAALLADDLAGAGRHLRRAASAELPGQVLSQLNAMAYFSLLQCERGELHAAESGALAVISRATVAGLARTVQVAAAYLTMARVALDRDVLAGVDAWLNLVAEVEARAPEPHVQLLAALVLAARREVAGYPERALSGLRASMREIDGDGLPKPLLARSMLAEAALLARLGEPRRARAVLEELGSATTGPMMLDAARLLLQLDDRKGALALRRRMEPTEHPRALVDVGLLDTALALAAGDEETALGRLEDALVAAAPWCLRHAFLVESSLIRPLLERRLELGTLMPTFTVDLLGRTSRDAGLGKASSAGFDPPTRRERTVLRYLATTMSNAEIAEALYLSVNTVKTHQRALYRKLRASNRREAVARARALDLL